MLLYDNRCIFFCLCGDSRSDACLRHLSRHANLVEAGRVYDLNRIYQDIDIDDNDRSVYLISPEDFDDIYMSPINIKIRVFDIRVFDIRVFDIRVICQIDIY